MTEAVDTNKRKNCKARGQLEARNVRHLNVPRQVSSGRYISSKSIASLSLLQHPVLFPTSQILAFTVNALKAGLCLPCLQDSST